MKPCRRMQPNEPIVSRGVVRTKELMTQKYFEFFSWKLLDEYNVLGQNGPSPKYVLDEHSQSP